MGDADPTAVAADWAAARVDAVRDSPAARLALMTALYERTVPGLTDARLRYVRAVTAFMRWQIRRGLLAPTVDGSGGSPWWRAVNLSHLRDTAEAGALASGMGGAPSSPAVELCVEFVARPTSRNWYRAHNASIVSAYLDHRELAADENSIERFFLNLVLTRVLYAHALVAAPRFALGWFAPLAPLLGDPRVGMTGIFLSLRRVLPATYPLRGELRDYTDAEHGFGRLLDVGFVGPRLDALYDWSADELMIPELRSLISAGVPSYAWDPDDSLPWRPRVGIGAALARKVIPPGP
ncbi:hypothetical protein [Tsukamurella sp. NPDC003166]|uniref:hypothetical protein n=1 Tax=Tsukamurella sp. NPDC003166 TaxID=3154444 RepID=UPI0033B9BC27